jgi:Tol biopolymer transport system component
LSSGLFLTAVDGTGLRRLTANDSDRFPVYSPSGRQITFIRATKGSGYHVWLMNANGRHQHRLRLAPALSSAIRTAWMPDGRSLVIATGGAFFRISATSGKVLKELTPTYDASLDPLQWSLAPNGKTIAYIGRRPEPAGCQRTECEVFALYLQRVTSSKPKRAIPDVGVVAGWSPDSRRIVYTHGGIVIQAVAGGSTKVISVPPDRSLQGEAPPAWQPR